jgi:hypothetical protein
MAFCFFLESLLVDTAFALVELVDFLEDFIEEGFVASRLLVVLVLFLTVDVAGFLELEDFIEEDFVVERLLVGLVLFLTAGLGADLLIEDERLLLRLLLLRLLLPFRAKRSEVPNIRRKHKVR